MFLLTTKDVYRLQTDYSIADESFQEADVTFEEYLSQCRTFVSTNIPEDYISGGWDGDKKETHLINLVTEFVDLHKVQVKGYVSREGVLNAELLLEDLVDSITGLSILREALEDPEVDEIQINDKNTIFVSKGGVLVPYVDSKGRVMQFVNNQEIHIIINKLIEDGTGNTPLFTEGKPILNTKTARDQFRVSAVHHVANTQDKPPHAFPITTVVIRKFKEVKLTVEDLIENGAITEKMGRLLTLLGRAELKLFCIGPTGSGKTTLLNIISETIPHNKRIILAQNPTEITFTERDEYGRNKRNVVHWEVMDKVKMDELITNTLRFTPEIILVGEARESDEFFQIMRAMRTGHKVLGTYHAEDAVDAVGRFATEIGSTMGASYSESIRLVSDTVDIVISQFKFPDGRRRVMEIAEILGVDASGKVEVNKLFEFKMTGESVINEHGLEDVKGRFRQVGKLSEKTQNTLFKAGISKDTIEEFLAIDNSDVEKMEAEGRAI